MSSTHGNPVVQATYDPVERRLVIYVIGEGKAKKLNAEAFQDLQAAMARCALVCRMSTEDGKAT